MIYKQVLLSALQKHVGLWTTCIQLQYLQVKWNHRCEQKHDLTYEYLVPWMSLYLRKPELSIVGIHASYLLAGWSTKNLQTYHMTLRNTMAEEQNVYVKNFCSTLIISTN
jgi:hypothetical protein